MKFTQEQKDKLRNSSKKMKENFEALMNNMETEYLINPAYAVAYTVVTMHQLLNINK